MKITAAGPELQYLNAYGVLPSCTKIEMIQALFLTISGKTRSTAFHVLFSNEYGRKALNFPREITSILSH